MLYSVIDIDSQTNTMDLVHDSRTKLRSLCARGFVRVVTFCRVNLASNLIGALFNVIKTDIIIFLDSTRLLDSIYF